MQKPLLVTATSVIVAVVTLVGVKAYDRYAFGPADLANGKEQYRMHCIGCHGVKGHGDGVLAAELEVPADNISEELANPFGFKQELIESIYIGDNGQQGQMPAFQGVLSKNDINDALEYIRSVNEKRR